MSPQAEVRRWRGFAALLALALLAALAALAPSPSGYVAEADRPLVERAVRETAAGTRERLEDVRARSTPAVVHTPQGPCVELRSSRPDGAGTSVTCFDARTGGVLSQRISGGH